MENYDEWQARRHGVVENSGKKSTVDGCVGGVTDSVYCRESKRYGAYESFQLPTGEDMNEELQPSSEIERLVGEKRSRGRPTRYRKNTNCVQWRNCCPGRVWKRGESKM